MNYFEQLAKIDVSEHIERKGNFSYLSWPFAVEKLALNHPDAEWKVHRFPLINNPEITVPYMQTPLGYFVEVTVTINSVERSQIHPVLDNRNRPIENPNPFDINTSIQRCLVKAVALHGLGLYIYAGEDLPTVREIYSQEQWDEFSELVKGGKPFEFTAFCQANEQILKALIEKHLEPHRENKTVTKEQTRIKDLDAEGHRLASEMAEQITINASEGNIEAINEAFEEMSPMEKQLIWVRLDDPTKNHIKELKEAA